jgi:hypothetical protein
LADRFRRLPPRLSADRLHELLNQDLKVGSMVRKPSRSPRFRWNLSRLWLRRAKDSPVLP